MTFDKAAWAINGPDISAALARRALYATSRQSGIIQKTDLKVNPLSTPGQGVVIDSGVGVVLNGYQGSSINEAYVVSNPGGHTIPALEMPASNPAAQSYIVAVVIGDEDFSQVGHPWMTSEGVPDGTENTFNYVRPMLIPVANSTVTSLSGSYPALVLARIDIPANTTTITAGMITDLRRLANPRQSQQIFVSPSGTWTSATSGANQLRRIPSGSSYGDWGPTNYQPSVAVPSWAKRAIVVASINGIVLSDASVNVAGGVRTQLGSVSGPATGFDIPSGISSAMRMDLQTAGEYDCSAIAGTTAVLRVEGYQNVPASPSAARQLTLREGSQMIFDVRFFEE